MSIEELIPQLLPMLNITIIPYAIYLQKKLNELDIKIAVIENNDKQQMKMLEKMEDKIEVINEK